MKRFVSSVLLITLSSAVTISAAHAQTSNKTVSYNRAVISTSNSQPNPHNLAFLAYRGYLKDQGIQGGDRLLSDISSGKVTAKDIVQKAVQANRLPQQSLNNTGYINSLKLQLDQLKSVQD